jgi:hypothetical protein
MGGLNELITSARGFLKQIANDVAVGFVPTKK